MRGYYAKRARKPWVVDTHADIAQRRKQTNLVKEARVEALSELGLCLCRLLALPELRRMIMSYAASIDTDEWAYAAVEVRAQLVCNNSPCYSLSISGFTYGTYPSYPSGNDVRRAWRR